MGSNVADSPFGECCIIFEDQGFRSRPSGHGGRGRGFLGVMQNRDHSEYNQTINKILENNSDVNSLLSQGYSVSVIIPIIKNTREADGTIATKATNTIVTLQNGTSSIAKVDVESTNAKVTQITILTRTVIDKTTN